MKGTQSPHSFIHSLKAVTQPNTNDGIDRNQRFNRCWDDNRETDTPEEIWVWDNERQQMREKMKAGHGYGYLSGNAQEKASKERKKERWRHLINAEASRRGAQDHRLIKAE